jgi:uncharacterized protein YegL
MTSPLIPADALASAARRHPIALIVDCSWSVRHHQAQVAELLRRLPGAMEKRGALRHSAELAIVYMNRDGVAVQAGDPTVEPFGFHRLSEATLPAEVICDGVSQLGLALDLVADIIERRCRQISDMGRSFVCPYIGVLGDGIPTDAAGRREDIAWRAAALRVRELLDGCVRLEAFALAGTDGGVLPELVAGRGSVHPYDPNRVAEVIEAISFSVERSRQRRVPASVIADDVNSAAGAGQ